MSIKSTLLQNVACDEKESPPASVSSKETTSTKQNVIATTASHKDVEVEFIGADFCKILISLVLFQFTFPSFVSEYAYAITISHHYSTHTYCCDLQNYIASSCCWPAVHKFLF